MNEATLNKASFEIDSARAILSTYQQVNDNPQGNRLIRSKLQKRNKTLEIENTQLKEKNAVLQRELIYRDKKLLELHQQLFEKNTAMARLQEDFENAIYQLSHGKRSV